MLVIHSNKLMKTFNIIRTITLINDNFSCFLILVDQLMFKQCVNNISQYYYFDLFSRQRLIITSELIITPVLIVTFLYFIAFQTRRQFIVSVWVITELEKNTNLTLSRQNMIPMANYWSPSAISLQPFGLRKCLR